MLVVGVSGPVRGPHPIRASGKSVKDDSVVQSEIHTQFGPVNRKRKYRAGWWEKKIEAPRLVAGVMRDANE